jgi:hypothetical protein
VGLIAREIEHRGIATVCLSSAWSITRSVNPPRAVYTDFPLGHTAGKPHDRELQRAILRNALQALERFSIPGTIEALPYRWTDDDSWKDRVMRPQPASGDGPARAKDDRVERLAEPQYQYEEDRRLAGRNAGCPGCLWLTDR